MQGLSLTLAIVTFDLEKQRLFIEGQMYVALNRVTSILQENRCDTIYTDNVDSNSLTVSLLNTRSLKRHAVDINRARQLTENNTLCLTESQIAYDTNVTELL